MKKFKYYFRIEPLTSFVEEREDHCNHNFKLKKGDKIAEITKTPPYHEVVIVMEADGKVIAEHCDRIAIVVEGDKIINAGNFIYKLSGYKRDVVDECDYQAMRQAIDDDAGLYNADDMIDEIIADMLSKGIVAIYA